MASKITQTFYNVKFWIKTKLFVKPTLWLDERTNPNVGYAIFKISKSTSKWLIFFAFPILFVTLAMLTVTVGGNPGEWNFHNENLMLAVWTMVGFFSFLGLTLISWFWFKKFEPLKEEKILDFHGGHTKKIILREDVEKEILTQKAISIDRKSIPEKGKDKPLTTKEKNTIKKNSSNRKTPIKKKTSLKKKATSKKVGAK